MTSLLRRATQNRYIPHQPTAKQAAFLTCGALESLYGGQAGGGKSDALLMAALMFVDVPGYAALLLRRSYSDLALPGALMDRAAEWLSGTAARWDGREKAWRFPSGASLVFGYLATEADRYRYQSSEFQFCGFDELAQFTALQYTYLFSRLRRLKNSPVPIRMRAASNPGGVGHAWVYDRFPIGRPHETQATGRVFIPAGLKDNPHIDQAEYVRSLSELDDITKAQLLDGAWVTDPSRRPFDMTWWRGRNRWGQSASEADRRAIARFISWDTALKEENESDFTSCAVFDLMPDYRLVLRSMWKEKLDFPRLLTNIEEIANLWRNRSARQGADVVRAVIIEDKGSGTSALQTLRKAASPWLRERLVAFAPTTGKIERARQAALWCSRDCVVLPAPGADVPWLHEFETELQMFPDVTHDDQVDAFTQCILYCENLLATGWHARQSPDAYR